jgi:hypothetical protein
MKMFSHRERGANLVEFALVVPIVLLVVIGILEVGVAFRDLLTVSNAAKEGVRVVAAMGDDPMSDCVVLTKTSSALSSSISLNNLLTIEIFRALPNGTQSHDTNVYTLPVGADPTVCTEWSPNPMEIDSLIWSPLDRNVTIGPDDELDIAGVRVTYTHNWITGFPPFSGSFVVDESTVSRLEPEEYA